MSAVSLWMCWTETTGLATSLYRGHSLAKSTRIETMKWLEIWWLVTKIVPSPIAIPWGIVVIRDSPWKEVGSILLKQQIWITKNNRNLKLLSHRLTTELLRRLSNSVWLFRWVDNLIQSPATSLYLTAFNTAVQRYTQAGTQYLYLKKRAGNSAIVFCWTHFLFHSLNLRKPKNITRKYFTELQYNQKCCSHAVFWRVCGWLKTRMVTFYTKL